MATYKAINQNVEWEDPEEPDDDLETPKSTGTFPSQEFLRKWQRATNQYTIFTLTQEALKTQILKSVDDQYINALEHTITKYSQVKPRALLAHLWKQYGKIAESDLRANRARMNETWQPPTPIEDLYKQLRDGQKFARTGGEDITDSMLMNMAYDQVHATGIFTYQLEAWRDKPGIDKTWENFQTYFSKKVTDYLLNTTANEAKYSAAQCQVIWNQNIAAYVAANEEAHTQDTTPPPEPQPAANALTEKDIDAIAKKVAQLTGTNKPKTATTSTSNNSNSSKTSSKVRIAQGFNTEGEAISYCWSHGITKNLAHNSQTCQRKKEGHQDKATLNNRMNGSNEVCEKRA